MNRGMEPMQGSTDIVTSMLWNDPCHQNGTRPSNRGAWGLRLGPDKTAAFLRCNKVTKIYRSHEEIYSIRDDYEGCTTGTIPPVPCLQFLQTDFP